ncbi:MAG: UvrD-helicase domain-containing protein [Synergistaceae bacterium]|nr:UvrD-helicase domain-containing protein [Synergistaceae bacterium]
MKEDSILNNKLNKEQQDAVNYCEEKAAALLVLAGAGSGKTRVITHKAAYLISEKRIPPWKILAITFTNKAAAEMRERIRAMTGEISKEIQISTFHSFGLKFMFRNSGELSKTGLRPNFAVFDRADSRALIKEIMENLHLNTKEIPPSNVLEAISNAKSKWKPDNKELDLDGLYLDIANSYRKALIERNAADFDDLLIYPLKMMSADPELRAREQARLSWILVDEYQDVNQPQYLMLRDLVGENNSIMVVGDPDQSIYGWRGADMRMILNFEKDFASHAPKRIVLEQNYRSTQNILSAANALIRSNSARHEKNLWCAKKGNAEEKINVILAPDEYDESEAITEQINCLHDRESYSYGDIAILYRTNAMSRVYEQKFMRFGIPYRVIRGTAFYERKEVKDVLAYMRLAINPLDRSALLRVANIPARGLGAKTLEKISLWLESVVRSTDPLTPAEFWKLISDEILNNGGKLKSDFGQLMKLSPKISAAFHDFAEHIANISSNSENISSIFTYIMNVIGYEQVLRDEYPEDWEERAGNIEELRSLVPPEGNLAEILAEAALFTDQESRPDQGEQKVNMLTLHSAKGLEFPVVFIVGMEEAIFPNFRAFDDASQMEEERRLCYVGITRAEERLFLTAARTRRLFGLTYRNGFSRFIYEIPEELKITDDRGEESVKYVGYGNYGRYRGR